MPHLNNGSKKEEKAWMARMMILDVGHCPQYEWTVPSGLVEMRVGKLPASFLSSPVPCLGLAIPHVKATVKDENHTLIYMNIEKHIYVYFF